MDKSREAVIKIIYEVDFEGGYINISLDKYLRNNEDINAAFVTDAVYGIIRYKTKIDWIIRSYSSVRLKKISKWILCILRLGIYQMLYMDSVPDFAAVDECVNLAKKYGNRGSVSFVNALLRNVDKKDVNDYEYPSKDIEYAHPDWMIKRWEEAYGEEFTKDLLIANNTIADTCIRVNTLKTDRDTLLKNLDNAKEGEVSSNAILVKNFSKIRENKYFKEGMFQVQDQSSMVAVEKLDPKEGQLVVDVCSAPGGKCTYIAELMNNKGRVIARDIYDHKLKLIDSSCKRLGIDIVETEIFDALNFDEQLEGKAYRVLVDAPCSGYGIIRKKPDIKWKATEGESLELSSIQKKILNNASRYVTEGGRMVYSTCTISKYENEDVARDFLSNNSNFKLVEERQLFPNVDGTDGFYIAVFDRSSNE